MSLEQDDELLRYNIIGCAMEVHTDKGPGLDETVYHETLSALMHEKDIKHVSRPRATLVHRGIVADQFEADLLVPDRLILELKVLWGNHPPEDFCQLFSYLKFWRIRTGLLFDFGKERLKFRRLTWTEPDAEVTGIEQWMDSMAGSTAQRELAEAIRRSLLAILAQYGLGYRASTYRGLIAADLTADDIACVNQPVATIKLPGGRVHRDQFNCVMVAEKAAVLPVALHDEITAAACARLRSYLRHLGLPWGIVVNFGKRRLQVRCVSHADQI